MAARHSKGRGLAPIDSALEKCRSVLGEFSPTNIDEETEADVRLKVIDRMLREVLGWLPNNIQTERTSADGRVDYIVTSMTDAMVVEAKRPRLEFALQGESTHPHYKVSSSIIQGGETGEAVRQVMSYAKHRNLPLAVATNGLQWIVFLAARTDGIESESGFAFVFRSATELLNPDGFRRFYELLSREAVQSRRYLQPFFRLEGRLKEPPKVQGRRLLDHIQGPDRQRRPTDIARALDPVIQQLLTDPPPELERAITRHCFVTTKESDDADSRLHRILQELTDDIEKLDTRTDTAGLTAVVQDALAADHSRAALLVGQVGAGKSTFIDRFFEDVLPLALRRRTLIVRIDLAESRPDAASFPEYLRRITTTELKKAAFGSPDPSFEQLEGAFNELYQHLKQGELKYLYDDNPGRFKADFGQRLLALQEHDPESFLRYLLAFVLRSKRQLACVVYDNVDHLGSEIELLTFKHSQWLMALGRVLAILPVRDTTYWRARADGPFHAVAHSAFYLPRPPLDKVLGKRFEYAAAELTKLAAGKEVTVTSLRGFKIKVEDPDKLLRVLQHVFSSEVYPNEILRDLSGGDVRQALKLFRQCVTSPWMSLDKLLAAYLADGNYRLAANDRARFERAAILGNWEHFSQRRSGRVVNLLACPELSDVSPLLAARVLERIYEFRDTEHPRAGKGFEDATSLADYFTLCGVPPEVTFSTIARLVDCGLVEPFDLGTVRPDQRHSTEGLGYVAISPSGRLHRRWLQSCVTYAVLVVEDTVLFDESAFDQLLQLHDERRQVLGRPGKPDLSTVKEIEFDMARVTRDHVLARDAVYVSVPEGDEFAGQRALASNVVSWARG